MNYVIEIILVTSHVKTIELIQIEFFSDDDNYSQCTVITEVLSTGSSS